MTTPLRVAVLASGRGSNLAALIQARDAGNLPVKYVLVSSDRPAAEALRIAKAAQVPTLALSPKAYPDRRSYDLELLNHVAASGAEVLVLAGFMRILDGAALRPWVGRAINIHPSLLPKYRGLHTHRRALEAGDNKHGASVHFVTAELDGGPVIAQAHLEIRSDDNEKTLGERLLPLEHRLLPAVVSLMAARRLNLMKAGVALDGICLKRPLSLKEDYQLKR